MVSLVTFYIKNLSMAKEKFDMLPVSSSIFIDKSEDGMLTQIASFLEKRRDIFCASLMHATENFGKSILDFNGCSMVENPNYKVSDQEDFWGMEVTKTVKEL